MRGSGKQRRIAIDCGHDDNKAPAWFAHIPGGETMRIAYIGSWGPLVRFTGFDGTEGRYDHAFVSPDAVAISIRSLPPGSDEPRGIGFGDWQQDDEPSDGKAVATA